MASVWRAKDLTLARPVAVKILYARDDRDEKALVDQFLREARIAAAVQHRNVIHTVDFGTTAEGRPFMVMELLEG
jgi:serine/threonine-protein kinase